VEFKWEKKWGGVEHQRPFKRGAAGSLMQKKCSGGVRPGAATWREEGPTSVIRGAGGGGRPALALSRRACGTCGRRHGRTTRETWEVVGGPVEWAHLKERGGTRTGLRERGGLEKKKEMGPAQLNSVDSDLIKIFNRLEIETIRKTTSRT
jgi:hypothetical protein